MQFIRKHVINKKNLPRFMFYILKYIFIIWQRCAIPQLKLASLHPLFLKRGSASIDGNPTQDIRVMRHCAFAMKDAVYKGAGAKTISPALV